MLLAPLLRPGQVAQLTLQHLLPHAAAACRGAVTASTPACTSPHHKQQPTHDAQQHRNKQSSLLLLLLPSQLWPSQQQSQCLRQQQQQLVRNYHPATHAARTLTNRLLQQRTWQELRLLFDASGGGGRLNPIQLCALLQHLSRVAPAPELLTASERAELQGFALELTAACMRKAHRLDAVGLANMISSALKLGCIQPLKQPLQQQGQQQQRQQQQQQQQQDGLSQRQGYLYADLLSAATKQVMYANGHAAGMLLSALTSLHQQQQLLLQDIAAPQQQQEQLEVLQQQLALWGRFTAALSHRLHACAAARQLSSTDASRLCSTASRLLGLLAKQRNAAAAAAAAAAAVAVGVPHSQPQQQQQQAADDGVFMGSAGEDAFAPSSLHDMESSADGDSLPDAPFSQTATNDSSCSSSTAAELQVLQQQYSRLQQQLRGLLSLAAQKVEQQASSPQRSVAAAAAAPASLADVSRVLYALAKTWVWPGWPAVLGLLHVYSREVHAMHLMTAEAAAAVAEGQAGRGRRQRKQQSGQQLFTPAPLGVPGLVFAAVGGAGRSAHGAAAEEQTDAAAEALTAARESLAPSLWAAGRLVEQQLQHQHRRPREQQQQQQQQQQQWLLQEVQHHHQLWRSLGPLLSVCQQQLSWLGPLELAQVAAGLGKVVASSRALLQQTADAAAATAASPAAELTPMSLVDAVRTAGSRSISATAMQKQLAVAAEGLTEALAAPELRRLLQQHMARVESLLPLLALQHRLQIADGFGQLGLQVPHAVASVFARDQAAQQQ